MSKRCMGCMELYGEEFDICPYCGYVDGSAPEEAIHMEPGTILNNRYIIGKVLGYGGFGVTYLGWDGKLEQKVAIKEYLPSEFSTRMPGQSAVSVFNGEKSEQFNDGMNKFIDEAKRLAKFQNEPGIVCVFDSFSENGTAYIIMEYLEGETLSERLKREKTIPEDEAVKMLWPIMQSLKVVHAEGLLHRDIAPDNIFITNTGEVKLIDFGASRYATTSHSRSLSVIIKPGFSPEEQYRSRGDQGPHTDVYAVAATLYKMITGKTPPDAMERRAKIESKKKELLEDPSKIVKNISLNRENAIMNAMNVRIEDRTPDIDTFMKELNADPPVKRRYGKIKKIDVYSWPLWLKIFIPSVVGIFLVFGILLATGVIHFQSLFSDIVVVPEGMAVVPEVEGMSRSEAIEAIEAAGLLASGEGSVISQYVEAGKIILQDPMGGTYLMKNATVKLKICNGSGQVVEAVNGISTVPYIEWESEEDAISKLKLAGLDEPEIEYAYDDNVAEGHVISQSTGGGEEIEEGSKIRLVVSKGPAPFEMPNVIGMKEADAEKTLSDKGLSVSFEYIVDDSVPVGKVISQSITPGEMVKRGHTITITVSSKKETFTVPNVVGSESGVASATLKGQGFGVNIVENYSDTVEKGLVISQNPTGGSSQVKGATVTIVVSKGAQLISVPNVVGQNRSTAESTIINAGFTVNVSLQKSDTVEEGKVISQDPAGGSSKAAKSTITIVVSSGANLSTVPNVVGKDQSSAESAIKNAGLNVVVSTENSDSVASGTVISQNPAGGSSQVQGSTVNITVSKGPKVADVPNVVGKDQASAESAIKNAGFSVTVSTQTSDNVASGKVISQSPTGGSSQTLGSSVSIVVSSGSSLISVPNVVGMKQAEAEKALRDAGFNVNATLEASDTVADGKVISQSPGAGTNQKAQTTINISISNGPGSIEVPNLVGKTQGEAKSALEALGLVASAQKAYSDTVPDGVVINQIHEAGSKVQKGTPILFTVSMGSEPPQYVTVSFDGNGGSASAGSIQAQIGGTYSGLPSASREGFTFGGWFTDPTGGSQVDGSTTVTNSTSHTLYAHWSENSWSNWTDSLPGGVDANGYTIETQTEYRKRTKSTTSGSSNTMNGWTLTGSKVTGWGNWSAWQNNAVSASDTRQVETRNIAATYNTEYNYSRYTDDTYYVYGPSEGWWNYGENYCYIYQERGWGGALGVIDTSQGFNIYDGLWFNETTRQVEATPAYTQYRYRDAVITYYFEQWSGWSDWSTTAVSADSNTQVETRTMYRYKKK